jgi:hypothetical protein
LLSNAQTGRLCPRWVATGVPRQTPDRPRNAPARAERYAFDMNHTALRLLPVAALVTAAPAWACGEPHFTRSQETVLWLAVVSAPLLLVLLVDRGVFALSARASGVARKHRPSWFGPLLACVAGFAIGAAMVRSDIDVAFFGAVVLPFATAVCGLSFLRSVLIEQRGHVGAQLLRVVGVVGVTALLMASLWLHF